MDTPQHAQPWDDAFMMNELEHPELHPLFFKVRLLDERLKRTSSLAVADAVVDQSVRVGELIDATEHRLELLGQFQELNDERIVQLQTAFAHSLNSVTELVERLDKLAELVVEHSRVLARMLGHSPSAIERG
jgi:hypothetical protein